MSAKESKKVDKDEGGMLFQQLRKLIRIVVSSPTHHKTLIITLSLFIG